VEEAALSPLSSCCHVNPDVSSYNDAFQLYSEVGISGFRFKSEVSGVTPPKVESFLLVKLEPPHP